MAEIKIEKKKPIWPWILVILIILAAIYFFWYYNDNIYDADKRLINNDTISQIDNKEVYDYENNNRDTDSTTLYSRNYGTIRKETAVADYLNYVDTRNERSNNTNNPNEYYRNSFFKLITATKRTSEIKNVDISSHIDEAMKNAEMLTNDNASTQKTENIREAAVAVSKALKKIQQDSFDNLSSEANAVETAANNINARGSINEESNDVNTFLDKAAILLQKIYEKEENNQ